MAGELRAARLSNSYCRRISSLTDGKSTGWNLGGAPRVEADWPAARDDQLRLRDVRRYRQTGMVLPIEGAAVMGGLTAIPSRDLLAGLAVRAPRHDEQSERQADAFHRAPLTYRMLGAFALIAAATFSISSASAIGLAT